MDVNMKNTINNDLSTKIVFISPSKHIVTLLNTIGRKPTQLKFIHTDHE